MELGCVGAGLIYFFFFSCHCFNVQYIIFQQNIPFRFQNDKKLCRSIILETHRMENSSLCAPLLKGVRFQQCKACSRCLVPGSLQQSFGKVGNNYCEVLVLVSHSGRVCSLTVTERGCCNSCLAGRQHKSNSQPRVQGLRVQMTQRGSPNDRKPRIQSQAYLIFNVRTGSYRPCHGATLF